MRYALLPVLALALGSAPVYAQLSDADLQRTIGEAETNPSVLAHLQASNAARLMRDYDTAREHLDASWQAMGPVYNGFVSNQIMLELASGGGVIGAQRAFRELRDAFHLPPIIISNIAGNYPELLASGEFDDMVLRFSPDATDPDYRCGCLGTVAWVHRLAGREDEAQAIWSTLADQEIETVAATTNPDTEAEGRGQLARDLARAGRHEEAREQLRMSMAVQVSEAALPSVRRRWAQAYAELGDVASTIEHIEPLLEANSLITVHTLESRVTWAQVRPDPAFQAMLSRHK